MLTEPFLEGIEVLEIIEQTNHQAFFVGGCVRDFLLNKPIKDIDITTSASPTQIQQIFSKVIPVGVEHGTVIVRHNHKSYEITTFRMDGNYTDQRHPDSVHFIDRVNEDLQRRDFTINALAMNKHGHIIDLFNGREDLNHKVIRSVGNGYNRFIEDPLRIIRALRFSSQLGFMIESNTLQNMEKVKHHIETLATERITAEMTKLFAGNDVNNGVKYLKSTKVHHFLPILNHQPQIIEKLPQSLIPLASFGEVIALFYDLEPMISISNWVYKWKCSNKIKHESIQLSTALSYYKLNGLDKWLIYQLSSDYYEGFVRLVNIIYPYTDVHLNQVLYIDAELPIQSKQDLLLDGNDLVHLFPNIKKGPWIRQTLQTVEKKIVLKELNNTKSDIKEWIICNPPEIN